MANRGSYPHLDILCLHDDVVVGDNVTQLVEYEPRSLALRHLIHTRGELIPNEEVDEGRMSHVRAL